MSDREPPPAVDPWRSVTPLDAQPADATAPAAADDPLGVDQPVQTEPAATASGRGRAIREIVETILLALLIFVAVRMVVLNFRVDGPSMIPQLDDGELLLVNRNAYASVDLNGILDALPFVEREGERLLYPFAPPERGDIVVFDPPVPNPEQPYIKRVIGLPGEHLTMQNGRIFIDGIELVEPYIVTDAGECEHDAYCDLVVPEGSVYVIGDNRYNSSDSRHFGVVDLDAVIGKAWLGYWPRDQIGTVDHYDYPEIPDR